MREILLGIALIVAVPVSVTAGPKDEAYQNCLGATSDAV
jgi:hypothetical protein